MKRRLDFNRPLTVGTELGYVAEAIEAAHLSGNGAFTKRCTEWLEREIGSARALLTHSCTGALEMAALLAGVGPGDEVIMPSFTFVSTANAFVLRGATPVFVDIRPDTLNLDERLVADAITPRTRAIVPVHYGGVGCDMDALCDLAREHGLRVIEDAAHALLATRDGRPLGGIGDLATLSFHETKNVISGEGGALLINDPQLVERAEIVLEKGTNRAAFNRGERDKYTWVDVGSSFVPSELTAAFLWGQLEHAREITAARVATWGRYHERFAALEEEGLLRRPIVPPGCRHSGHVYPVLAPDAATRDELLRTLNADGVHAVFHYVPLHSSPAGRRLGRAHGDLPVTDDVAARLLRMPLWVGLEPDEVDEVVAAVGAALDACRA